ncbi:bromodomain-containing protein 7 [Periophthalmus magnuspinnatus]|uniref:bromodomain-containing protein 7 n=1 Tax=Periophthalmus magnuspinnatus TaxID=409849 RepID=UPI00145B45D8|nr:bromodomain-containing protein 7 [Periophthalmus magnuspinnatus]
MGKKHKKHKSDKHAHEEFNERPLKLVLKVSGNEVTTGSSSRDTFYDDQSTDNDKPNKDKKKKKKKDKDRGFSSPEDKGKKKMAKKRKVHDGEGDEDSEQCRTPIRSELDKLEAEKEQTPLQEALNQLLRQLQRKDPSAFFSFPVTDLIAPGYSTIIKRPMDFSTMKEKVKKEQYQSLDELKVDFKTMCENAMIYNKPETIYHRAARKLLYSGLKILSQERLQSLKQSIEFMSGLDPAAKQTGKCDEPTGLDPSREGAMTTDSSESSQAPSTPRHDKDSKEDPAKAEKELEEIRKVIEESGGKLSNRVLQCDLEFARQKTDGSTTLAILNPADPAVGDVGYCPVKLGMMSNRLQSGVNCLQGFREDKRNRITPVSYMNYGPFTSFAPTYDSSFANISKDDSDLIYSFYGEESSLQGSDSLSEFLAKSDEYVYKMADNILDAMTNGEHSKILKETGKEQPVEEPTNTEVDDKDGMEVMESEAPKIENLTDEECAEEVLHIQQKLDETTKLLRDLQEAQKERLSTKQPPNTICLLAPTTKELELVEKVTGNLTKLTGQVAPSDVCSLHGIRKAMGISLPFEMAENFIDLSTVQETAEPMETLPTCPDVAPVVAVN